MTKRLGLDCILFKGEAKLKARGKSKLQTEAKRASRLLRNKVVSRVFRHTKKEFGIEFKDGTRLFVDHLPEGVDLTIT